LAASDISAILITSFLLILLVLGGFWAVMRLRRWLQEEDAPTGGIGFSLSDLRELHRTGKMTDEEYERAKNQMLSGAKAMAEKMPHPLSRPNKRQGEAPAEPNH